MLISGKGRNCEEGSFLNLLILFPGKFHLQGFCRKVFFHNSHISYCPKSTFMFEEYLLLGRYLLVSLALVLLLFGVSFFFVYQQPEMEKLSSYECGFNPFGDARSRFEVRFYLVGVLFLIFDLELSFLFPFVVNVGSISWNGLVALYFFLAVLTLGFAYEWIKGALEWT